MQVYCQLAMALFCYLFRGVEREGGVCVVLVVGFF